MKKPIVTCIGLFFLFVNSFSQDNFKVIKVNGTIVLKQKNISLETGTVFSAKEDLLFRNEDATAAVINAQRGRLIITNSNHDLSSASSNYLPSMSNISTRGGTLTTLTNIAELQNLFAGRYVVLDKCSIVLDETGLPLNTDHFFFLRFIYKGEEINKKIGYRNDTLIIDKKNLYSVDGNPITSPDNTSVKLFYRRGSESLQVSDFELIFPNMNQLNKEVKIIIDEVKTKPYKEQINEVNAYINDFYGKVYMPNLLSWLDINYGLKMK
jgi:hypothetical protein